MKNEEYEEYKCHECKGKGSIDITYTTLSTLLNKMIIPCDSCNGTGKVDWIKHAMKINETLERIRNYMRVNLIL